MLGSHLSFHPNSFPHRCLMQFYHLEEFLIGITEANPENPKDLQAFDKHHFLIFISLKA